jgi:exodeoxyribonuclease VII large subunit
LGRPSGRVHESRQRLLAAEHRLQRGLALTAQSQRNRIQASERALPLALGQAMNQQRQRLERSSAALALLDPQLVLERGYVMLTDAQGALVTRVMQVQPGDALRARLRDGELGVRVTAAEQSP